VRGAEDSRERPRHHQTPREFDRSKRIREIEHTTNHDVIAFLTNVAENVGPAVTPHPRRAYQSDVVDTALAVQMVESADILIDDVKALRAVIAKKAKKYKLCR